MRWSTEGAKVEISRRLDVLEKDVDIVLARALRDDKQFRKQFITFISDQCGVSFVCHGAGVDRQFPHEGSRGAIDILLRLFSDRKEETGRLLIENKVNSGFTPDQPERYAASAGAMSRLTRPAVSVICAPEEYLRRSRYLGPFQARVAYEKLAEWLGSVDREVIDLAVLRFAMPPEPDPVPEVADFHEGYKRLVAELAPELVVKPSPNTGGARPNGSYTMYFDAKKPLPTWDFLPTLSISHQCVDSGAPNASVKVIFRGWAKFLPDLQAVSRPHLSGTRMYLRVAGNSMGLVHDTPRLNNKLPVKAQREAVVIGIRAAASLRAWMFGNEAVLRQWALIVARRNGD